VKKLEDYAYVKEFKRDILCKPESTAKASAVFTEGVSAVFQSKYLLSIVAIVGLYEIVSTIIDFLFTSTVSAAFPARDAMAAFQGKVFFVAQIASLLVLIGLTPYIHKHHGIMAGLLFLPVALLIGSVTFLLVPILYVITFCIGSEAAFFYSINQISKEILYVPLANLEKVKGKAFIDMFVFRGSKAISAIILLSYSLFLSKHGWTSSYLMTINIVAIGVWLVAIQYAGKIFSKEYNHIKID